MVLLIYLYEQPIVGDSSVTHFLIDEVFDIFWEHLVVSDQNRDFDHCPTLGAHNIWKLLDKLRRKVYIHVGWHLQVLPSVHNPEALSRHTFHTEQPTPRNTNRPLTFKHPAPTHDSNGQDLPCDTLPI